MCILAQNQQMLKYISKAYSTNHEDIFSSFKYYYYGMTQTYIKSVSNVFFFWSTILPAHGQGGGDCILWAKTFCQKDYEGVGSGGGGMRLSNDIIR